MPIRTLTIGGEEMTCSQSPRSTLVAILLEPLLEKLTRVPRLAITTAVTVPIMTWLAMPRGTRLLRGWLYPRTS